VACFHPEGIVTTEPNDLVRKIETDPVARASAQGRRTALGLLGPLLVVSWGALAGVAPAQAPSRTLPPKSFMNKSVLALPIVIDGRLRPSLREVQLFVKDSPAKPWTFQAKAPPTQAEFLFKAPRDGEYWFTIVTVDKAGRQVPADLTSEPPGVVVVVDTQAPQVEVRTLPATGDETRVHCAVCDANADPTKLHFEYQTGDLVWRPLEAQPGQPDTFRIPAEAVLTGRVRVEAVDRAGNVTTREVNVKATATAALPPAAGPEPINSAAANDGGPALPPPDTKPQVVQAAHSEPAAPTTKPDPMQTEAVAQPHKTDSAPAAMPKVAVGPTVTAHAAPTNRQIVNTRRVFLDYKIDKTGPSGVGKVEIWLTRDRGKSWEHVGEDADRVSPAEVELPGEGLFGVKLVVSNGRGYGATPPATGDAPDWWIEVDQTPPVAELLSVQPSRNGEAGVMVISYRARDKNLGDQGIDLYWSAHQHGPWSAIAKGLKNDGHFRWSVPQEVGGQAYVRMTVADQAHNLAECSTAQAVAIDDLSRPRIRVVGVTTGEAESGPAVPYEE
jgi:hypothetical protein